jgi:hypothetical protein
MAKKGDKVSYFYTNGAEAQEGEIVGIRDTGDGLLLDLNVGERFEHGVQLVTKSEDALGRHCMELAQPAEETGEPG